MAMTPAQAIECFHLCFLGVLRTNLDQKRYILKGGVNLRYFFSSVRYSEDIDLDMTAGAPWRHEAQVDKTLESAALHATLRASRIRVITEDISKPKQTATTRRWKIPLEVAGQSDPLRTKVEFSDRNGDTRHTFESILDEVVAPYGIRPPSVQHYLLAPATEQKVVALADRSETQARDVFDLDMLFRRSGLEAGAVPVDVRARAADAAARLPYEAFLDQVVPFLEPAVVSAYDRRTWEQMQEYVMGVLLQ